MNITTPIALSANLAAIPANATRGVTNPSLLRNPFKTAMLIDQINFQIEIGASNSDGSGGTTMRVQFTMGPLSLSRGYVPVAGYCKTLDWSAIDQTSYLNASSWIWRPPKPIYVPPGEYLVPTFFNSGMCSGSRDVQITYIGRSLPKDFKRPKSIALPWVTPFIGAGRALGANNTDQSIEIDLANPFDVPLHLQRMTGRVSLSTTSSEKDVVADQLTATASNIHIVSQYTLMQMVSSDNDVIIRDSTPMHLLFGTSQAIDIRTVLKPNSFFKVFLEENYSSLSGAGTTLTPVITLIGHREVSI